MDNRIKVRMVAARIAFLMPHQEVSPDLELQALDLASSGVDLDKANTDTPEYLAGAQDALLILINMLKGKGPQIRE